MALLGTLVIVKIALEGRRHHHSRARLHLPRPRVALDGEGEAVEAGDDRAYVRRLSLPCVNGARGASVVGIRSVRGVVTAGARWLDNVAGGATEDRVCGAIRSIPSTKYTCLHVP